MSRVKGTKCLECECNGQQIILYGYCGWCIVYSFAHSGGGGCWLSCTGFILVLVVQMVVQTRIMGTICVSLLSNICRYFIERKFVKT